MNGRHGTGDPAAAIESRPKNGQTSRLAAVCAAAIIATGLVAAPDPPGVLGTQHEPVLVQLRSIAVELTATTEPISTATTSPRRAAAAPQANVAGPTVDNVARLALLVALTPVWYAALPITLPATVAVVYFVLAALSCIGRCGVGVNPAAALQVGFSIWADGPLA